MRWILVAAGLCAAGGAAGQEAGEGEREREEATHRAPLELPAVRVTASPAEGEPAGVAQATARLAGRGLDREAGASLAETLGRLPGVAVRSMGPGASMPVLRGLTGDRVLVLHDGARTGDLAGSADDHATTLEPLAAQRVEVIRGPAALLYGSNALGGVVNLVSDDLPLRVPARAEWSAAAQAASAQPGGGASARVTGPLGGGWAATARLGARGAGAQRLPGGALLRNSDAASRGGAFGFGRGGAGWSAAAGVRGHAFSYGLPVAPGTAAVRLEGARAEVRARAQTEGVRAEAGVQRYAHDELDAATGEVLQRFGLRTGTASLLVRRGERAAWGATLLAKEHDVQGPEALTPPARSGGAGLFGYREAGRGALVLQLGARADGFRVASATAPKFGTGRARSFGALSGSAGLRWDAAPGVTATLGVSSAFRAPTVEELFSSAAHAGTGAVELGDPALRAERAASVEAGVHAERAGWAATAAAYRTRIDRYVHLAARGDTVIGGARLPVLVYAQAPAEIVGVEGAAEVALGGALVLALSGDALRGSLRGGEPLSYMPAPSLAAGLRHEGPRWSLGGDVRRAFAQTRVGAADELPTPGHTLVRLHGGLRVGRGGAVHTLTLRIDNLLDAEVREATSRTKDFAPGAGRSLSLLYRVIR